MILPSLQELNALESYALNECLSTAKELKHLKEKVGGQASDDITAYNCYLKTFLDYNFLGKDKATVKRVCRPQTIKKIQAGIPFELRNGKQFTIPAEDVLP